MSVLDPELSAHVPSDHRPPVSPAALVQTFRRNRDLIWQMAKREVVGRYKGSVLGLLWSFFNPLLMLAVYTFNFGYIFRVRPGRPMAATQPATSADIFDFALYAFAGLILVWLLNEVIQRAPVFVIQNRNYVKRVVFPLEILPFVYLFAALLHAAMSGLVLLIAIILFKGTVSWTLILAPLALLPLIFLILGFAWFLSSLGVFLRDVAQTMSIVTMVLMYLSPVFYSLDMIHDPRLQILVRFNPLTIPMQTFRQTFLYGQFPAHGELMLFGIYFGASLLIAWLGFAFFQRTKRGFADVI